MSEAREIRRNMLKLGFVTPNLAERAAKRRARNSARYAAARSSAVAVARGLNAASRGLQLSKGEFKAVDVTTATTSVGTTPVFFLLNGMTSGSGLDQHIGREVTLKSLEIKYVVGPEAGVTVDQMVRVLLVYDRQTNGAAPAVTDVLTSQSSVSPRNLENRHRFKILYDRTLPINTPVEPISKKYRKFYRRLAHPVTFNAGVAGTVADITTGSLYLVAFGTRPIGANTAAYIEFFSRIRYQDA